MSWIINGAYIADDDCISTSTSDKDNVSALQPSICIDWE